MPRLSLALILLGAIGFFIAGYILRTKTRRKVLVCPLGHDCDAVVHSKYSALFGIPNEVLGLLYYGFIVIMGVLLTGGMISVSGIPFLWILLAASTPAFFMSTALTYIQIAVLRHYCTWCFASAVVNTLILTAAGLAFLLF